jgi:hypothetical protein
MVESMAFKKGSIHFADADDMAILPEPAKLGNGAHGATFWRIETADAGFYEGVRRVKLFQVAADRLV